MAGRSRQFAMMLLLALSALAVSHAQGMRLPVVRMAPRAPATGTVVILLTGDGGWSRVDRTIAARLVADGDAVVGLNSLRYFLHHRSRARVAGDLTELARADCTEYRCQRIVLMGYSMGADVLPFVVKRLGPDVRTKVAQLDLISLGHRAVFRFLPLQWAGILIGHKSDTVPRLASLTDIDVVCVYGTKDRDGACRDLVRARARLVSVTAGHRLSSVASVVADSLSSEIRALSTATSLSEKSSCPK